MNKLPVIRKAAVRVLTPCFRGGPSQKVTSKVPRVAVAREVPSDALVLQDQSGLPILDEDGRTIIDNTPHA